MTRGEPCTLPVVVVDTCPPHSGQPSLAFENEAALRARGCAKTPDFLLLAPIAVHGRIVCWIDSKVCMSMWIFIFLSVSISIFLVFTNARSVLLCVVASRTLSH